MHEFWLYVLYCMFCHDLYHSTNESVINCPCKKGCSVLHVFSVCFYRSWRKLRQTPSFYSGQLKLITDSTGTFSGRVSTWVGKNFKVPAVRKSLKGDKCGV